MLESTDFACTLKETKTTIPISRTPKPINEFGLKPGKYRPSAVKVTGFDPLDANQAGADLYAVWKRVKTEPTPVPTLPQTGGMLGLIGGLVAVILLTGAGIAFKRRG